MEISLTTDLILVIERSLLNPASAFSIDSKTSHSLENCTGFPQPEDLLRLSQNIQGVFWGCGEDYCLIATDRFGSVPIYVYETASRFVFSTNLATLFEHVERPLHIDKVAMWESILLDMPLAPRTLFQEIRQLDPGTLCKIAVKKSIISQDRYYNFTFPQISSQSVDKTVDDLVETLLVTLKDPHHSSVLLPLSGGIDSRLLAALLCQVVSPDDIYAVTFAFGPQSLEYRLAQQVCEKLKIKNHVLHRLTPDSYTAVLPDYTEKFGGAVSAFHAHLYSFLISTSMSLPSRLISGFFADAAAGYGSTSPQHANATFKAVSYYTAIEYWNNKFPVPGMDEITEDFEAIFKAWRSGSSITSFSEYMYVSQRQQQLLFPMAALYRNYLPVQMPYAIPSVAEILLGMPYEIRQFKDGIRMAIEKSAPRLVGLPDVSSKPRRATWQEEMRSLPLRFWHRFTIAIAMLTGDFINLPDFEKTENHAWILRTHHRSLLLSSVEYLAEVGLLGLDQVQVFSSRSYDDRYFPTPQYRLITLAYLIRYLQNKKLLSL